MSESGGDTAKFEDVTVLKKPFMGMRWVLVILCNLMFCLITLVNNSLAVTIVAMVNSTDANETENSQHLDVCLVSNNESDIDELGSSGEYNWSSSQQGLVLGAYFWGIFLGRFIGGRMGEIIGQTLTCGIGIFASGIIVGLCPLAADLSVYCFATARFLLGLLQGPAIPAVYSLMSKWAPRSQLATMISIIVSGFTIGGSVGLLTSGLIINNIGWRWVFWIQAIVSLAWVPFWFFFSRNDPQNHPYITPYEAKLLSANSNVTIKKSVPWKHMLLSPYIYVCIFGLFARTWAFTMQLTVGPSYLNKKIGLELGRTSIVAGIANIICLPATLFFGGMSDFLITKKQIRKIKIRKLMHVFGTCGPAFFYILLAIANCNVSFAIGVYEMIGIFGTATGYSINISVFDYAPNYTGTIIGIMGLGNIGGSLAPMITSYLLATDNGWNLSFYLTAGLSLVSLVVYLAIMTDKPQSWNYFDSEKDSKKESDNPKNIKNA